MDWTLFLKLISLVTIFIVCFIGGAIPIRLSRWFSDANTLSYANCVSGGILLGASLVHLLYDAEEQTFEYPLAHLCCGVGFFAAFILEKVLFSHEHDHGKLNEEEEEDPHSHEMSDVHHDHHSPKEPQKVRIELEEEKKDDEPIMKEIDLNSDTTEVTTKAKFEPHHQELSHTTGYVLFSVLALESFISGSALGVSESTLGVLVLFIAIITHIWAEAFALCVNLMKSRMPNKKILRMIVLFSSVTPLGILIGMLLQTVLQGSTAAIISSILISFAAGTFLYVAIVEVIVEEFEKSEKKWTKLNLLLIGFAFMSVLLSILFSLFICCPTNS